jgi:CHAD domain-containing protein
MKSGRAIDFAGVTDSERAIRQILRLRFAEVLERQSSLYGQNDDEMHAFRLACKRLRYAIERFEEEHPELQPATEMLQQMTDELGAAHDSVVLGGQAEKAKANITRFRTRQDRNRYVKQARRLWQQAFHRDSPFAALAQYTGFSWEPR